MAEYDQMHLMFCEGPHDAAFVGRLLTKILDFKKMQLNLNRIPYPIGSVLVQSMKTRAAEDLRLDLAKKFFLPDYCLSLDRVLVFIFNYGGANRPQSIPSFLKPVFDLLQEPWFSKTPVAPLSYVIFADADEAGSDAARRSISSDLGVIGEHAWLNHDWNRFSEFDHAAEQETRFGRVAACIWRARDKDAGTLEDILLDCLVDDSSFDKSRQFADSHFSWPGLSVANTAKRAKAAICIEGQGEKPGSSMAVMIDQSKMLSHERLISSASAQSYVGFLKKWLGSPN